MNKNKHLILIFIAAAAAIACLCGIFFCPAERSSVPLAVSAQAEESAFSLKTAQDLLSLCSLSYEAEALEAELSARGYSDFVYFERDQTSSTGSGIAAGIGTMEQNGSVYVTVVFRGTNKGEWYSNFHIGDGAEHSGFSAAADFSMEEILSYLDSHGLKAENIRLTVTGHSRGGAVANICAKRLTETGAFKEVTAYTFASPNTTVSADAHSSAYKSIYNIINTEDFICYIPLESWGYTRYGTDIELPKPEAEGNVSLCEKMQSRFLLLTGYNHTGYSKGHADVEEFLSAAAKIAPTVTDYYNKEIALNPHRMTLYEYMENAAALLSGDVSLSKGMILLSGSLSPSFHPITNFMIQGIRIEDFSEESTISHSAIGCAHTYETYQAWLEVLEESYFTQRIGE